MCASSHPVIHGSENVSRHGGLAAPLAVVTPVHRAIGQGVLVLDGRGGADEVQDGDLVRRARLGESWAHEMIYRRYVRLVGTTARRLLRNPADVEDVVHDTFLLAFRRIEQLNDPEALRAWLVRIAVSRAHRRFRWRRFVSLIGGEDPTPLLDEQRSNDASPEQCAELALLARVVGAMSLKLRTTWVLRHVVGYPLEEVAAACDCSLATVKRRLGKAEEIVQRHVGGEA
jgi:RNA polymerase sigma-70 factor (ECF subfamily)